MKNHAGNKQNEFLNGEHPINMNWWVKMLTSKRRRRQAKNEIKTQENETKSINVKPLPGNDVAPPLELNKEYNLIQTCEDKQLILHYDVGLKSNYNYVRSHATGEVLPNSGIGDIHWCSISRFKIVKE